MNKRQKSICTLDRFFIKKLKEDRSGKSKEPIIIGLTESHVAMVRRRQGVCCSNLVYDVIPWNSVQVFTSCVHRKELVLVPAGDRPIQAVACGDTWRDWMERIASLPLSEKKGTIRRGSFKIKGKIHDPFQDHSFDSPKSFLVDESYLNFWSGEATADRRDDHNDDDEHTGCC